MRKEKQEELYKKYPKIFGDKDKSPKETCMCWGIDCSDGWYDLIDRLCSHLQFNTDTNNTTYIIKNKFHSFISKTLDKFYSWLPKDYTLKNNNFKTLKYIPIYHQFKKFIWNLRKKTWNFERVEIKTNKYTQVVASQVKEKFGGLRFYVNSASSEQHAVISFVENLSYHTCEECGSNKEVTQTTGWIKTLCSDCLVKENK